MKFNPRYTQKQKDLWASMRDAVEGEDAIKARTITYLPKPNPWDDSEEAVERYRSYLARAHYFGVTGRTVAGLVGMSTKQPPEMDLPTQLEPILEDIDGSGSHLTDLLQKQIRENLITGRFGLFVDFPVSGGRDALPAITMYGAEDILNWSVANENGKQIVEFVVLQEHVEEADYEKFEVDTLDQVRVLALDDEGKYYQQAYRKSDGSDYERHEDPILPTDANGNRMDFIPFVFGGSVSNDPAIDPPVIKDVAKTNLAHFRNSADYEESVFLLGQPWPILTGLSRATIDRLEKSKVYFGSRSPLLLSEGEKAELLTAEPNTLASEAMEKKEEQMVQLGAQILAPSVVKTAEQSRSETNATYSQLSLAVANVSAATREALSYAGVFVRAGDVTFKLEVDFSGLTVDGQALAAIVAGWQAGAYPDEIKNDLLRKIGATRMSNEQIDDLQNREVV